MRDFFDWLDEHYNITREQFNRLRKYKRVKVTKEWLKLINNIDNK